MRINRTKSRNTEHFSIIKDIKKNGKRTTCVYENLGTIEKIKLRAGNEDPIEWLKKYVKDLNQKNKEESLPIIIKKDPNKIIEKNINESFNVGYLFLKNIYYKLKLNEICENISNKYQFKFNMNDIMEKLIYSRIIYPASKLKTLELSKKFIEQPNFEYHHIERALPIICKEMDYIQSEIYKNSSKYMKRNNKILYYDCTNYYFEIEEESGLKQYGKSKENKPNPIVQMGLFMDGDGIPLAFNITPGNTNEQTTLTPLEEKIQKDFEISKFVVCTDAGLSSVSNRKFNNTKNKRFITTQSLKKLKSYLKEEMLDLSTGWKMVNDESIYNIIQLRTDEELQKKYYNKTFYKERWINENGLEQRLIVTYSVKYQEYQRKIRNNQILRAEKIIENNPQKISKIKQNDPKRFIKTTYITLEGEVAKTNIYNINQSIIDEESKYDGLYAVCTNLEDTVETIIKANDRRWEIEESFRIMKSDFKSRPVFHSRDDMIKAHFGICFFALIHYRLLEKKLDEKYTVTQLLETIRNMELKKEKSQDYCANYSRTDLTDELHEIFGFRTDFEVIKSSKINKILKQLEK